MAEFSIYFIILDIWKGFEYASGIKYASSVMNMPQYSHNKIIIVIIIIIVIVIVIVLEFLSASCRFWKYQNLTSSLFHSMTIERNTEFLKMLNFSF